MKIWGPWIPTGFLSLSFWHAVFSHSVVSDSLRPHGLAHQASLSWCQYSHLENIEVGCHALPQGIFPTQGSNPGPLLCILAAKSLHSCPTLCDPIDGSPPGSAIPRILQARTLEWVAISFSNAWNWKVKVKSLSHVRLFETPWTAAYQAPPSMGFSRQEYWSGVPLPSPILSTVQTAKSLPPHPPSLSVPSLAALSLCCSVLPSHQGFSNLRIKLDSQPGGLVKAQVSGSHWSSWSSRSQIEPECLHFQWAPRWCCCCWYGPLFDHHVLY